MRAWLLFLLPVAVTTRLAVDEINQSVQLFVGFRVAHSQRVQTFGNHVQAFSALASVRSIRRTSLRKETP